MSLIGFMVFYTSLAVVDIYLMVRMIRQGPDGLGYWPEQHVHGSPAISQPL
jgi:cytochrome d ubiquinol oxidase subunit I